MNQESISVGDTVRVHAPGYHRRHGDVGTVVYHRSTVGVSIDGSTYGFTPDELIVLDTPEATA